MTHDQAIFVPATPYDESKEKGRFSRFDPGTRTLPAGFRLGEPYAPLPPDIVFEKDVAVRLRDGVTIYVDVFRPAGVEQVPVIVAWSPYGKSRGGIPSVTGVRSRLGIDQRRLSGLMKFEAPDPAFWCARAGLRGLQPRRPRRVQLAGRHPPLGPPGGPGRVRPGRVAGRAGLVHRQGRVQRELLPDHLAVVHRRRAAAAPGRHRAVGRAERLLPRPGRARRYSRRRPGRAAQDTELHRPPAHGGPGRRGRGPPAVRRPVGGQGHPPRADHRPGRRGRQLHQHLPLSRHVPRFAAHRLGAEVVAHPRPDGVAGLLLPGQPRRPGPVLRPLPEGRRQRVGAHPPRPVLAAGLRRARPGQPPRRAVPAHRGEPTTFHLDATSGQLTRQAPTAVSTVAYDADSTKGRAEFTTRFDEETHVVGYPKVRLWVEADGADDMDLFVFQQKLDANGKHLQELTVTTRSPLIKLATQGGASLLKNTGSQGRLRVWMRHLDENASTEDIPVQSFDRVEKLAAGQVAEVEIALFPVGWILHPGEQLRLVVSGRNLAGAPMMGVRDVTPNNHGRHIVHTGGEYDSFLRVPVRVVTGHGAPV